MQVSVTGLHPLYSKLLLFLLLPQDSLRESGHTLLSHLAHNFRLSFVHAVKKGDLLDHIMNIITKAK